VVVGRDFNFLLSFLPVALLDSAGNLKVGGCLRSALLKKGALDGLPSVGGPASGKMWQI
jgi:hypothetical protein